MNLCLFLFGALVGCSPLVDAPASAGSGPSVQAPAPAAADSWLAEDKLRHFTMSFAVTSMSYGAARLALEPSPARVSAAGLAAVFGVGKELADVRGGGPFSLKDLAWDAAGVALGFTFAQRIH